ncbi:MAG: cation diffusion facilitator family transporter [Bacillota bacterium]
MKSVDYKRGEQVTFYCLVGNLLLSVFKGVVGFLGGSKAMVADAFHSGSDVIATLLVYTCIKIAKKPADNCHMYGHGKIEPLAAFLVGFIMILTALLIVKSIVPSLMAQEFVTPSLVALVAAVVSIITKEIMFRVTYNTGRKINSEAITANAWDHRADAYSSIGTFIGIMGSILGGYLNIGWLRYFDPLAGILVAVLIIKMAGHILLKAIQGLMDASPEPEKVAEIKNITEGIEGVQAVSWIRGRYLGQHIVIDMAIEVNGDKTVEEGHNISISIKQQVMESVKEVGNVLVHINPHRLTSEKQGNHRS